MIVSGRNHGQYTRECLESVLSQDYGRFRITWIDDASDAPDRAVGIATALLNLEKHRVILRTNRMGGLFNVYNGMLGVGPGEVVFHMGGDDQFLRNDVLSEIANLYEDESCWFTHGKSWCSDNSGSFSGPALHDDFRRHPFRWLPSSWRSELTHKIDPQDLQVGGWWLQSSGDVALYTPILEMCGIDRLRCIDGEPSYLYRKHDQNDGKLDQRFQDFMGWVARSKPRYSRLDHLDAKPTRTPHQLPHGLAFAPQLPHATHITCALDGKQLKIGPG